LDAEIEGQMKHHYFILFLLFSLVSLNSWGAPPCPEYSWSHKEFSFASFNPPPNSFEGISFPGNDQVLYRGIYDSNAQFNLEKILEGLFGEKNWHIGSPIFFGLTQVIRNIWDIDHPLFPSGQLPLPMRDYAHSRRILPDLLVLQKCFSNVHLSFEDASVYAADLMNKVFERMNRIEIESRYFNLSDPLYMDPQQQKLGFGNNAADLIPSSTYDMIAALYGRKIVVMKDQRRRGLDLGYFNLIKNRFYFAHWVDNGEINVPGYIRADEVIGYQQRAIDRIRGPGWSTNTKNEIVYAVYKSTFKNRTIALVLDGVGQICLSEASDRRYYSCEPYWAKIKEQPVPYPQAKFYRSPRLEDRAPLLGVILLPETENTNEKNETTFVAEVLKWYGKKSPSTLDPETTKRISATKVNGVGLKWYPAQ